MENQQQHQALVESRQKLTRESAICKSITLQGLEKNDFAAITQSVGSSIAGILDRPPIAVLKRVLTVMEVNPVRIELFLAEELSKLAYALNIDERLNLQAEQIPYVAQALIAQYPAESLEDFVLCFRRGALGMYGKIFRLDAAVIAEWMARYLDEKYQLIELEHTKRKQEEAKEMPAIDYEKFKQRVPDFLKRDTQTNEKENAYQRWRLQYFGQATQTNTQTQPVHEGGRTLSADASTAAPDANRRTGD